MCKIVVIVGVSSGHGAALKRIMEAAVKPMCKSDPHGWGYAAIRQDGELFSEKWLRPSDALKTHVQSEGAKAFLESLDGAVSRADAYQAVGEPGPIASVLMHSRYATCALGIQNTHPFVNGGTALIHNGVVRGGRNEISTCDSEQILNAYLDAGVNLDPTGVQAAVSSIFGSYACAVATRDADGRAVVDIFRNGGSDLVAAYLPALGAAAFATTRALLAAILRKARVRFEYLGPVEPGRLIRLDALSGRKVEVQRFTPAAAAFTYRDLTGDPSFEAVRQLPGAPVGRYEQDWSEIQRERDESAIATEIARQIASEQEQAADDEQLCRCSWRSGESCSVCRHYVSAPGRVIPFKP